MAPKATAASRRFAFGENWQGFVADVDASRIDVAEQSLRSMLGVDDLAGRTFLDAGCGSGLFSLAAARLGAERVHSFDFDADSVRASESLRQRYLPDGSWTIERGDATDAEYCASLGSFDVVYSWGVLHHTGAMWQAMDNVVARCADGGYVFMSIYNDQGRQSRRWRAVKRLSNRLPAPLRPAYALAVMLPIELRRVAGAIARRDPLSYVRLWTRPLDRGMSHWHDMLDWVGGYPFDVAKPEEVLDFCRERGFELLRLKTVGGGLGCNEFVLQRK